MPDNDLDTFPEEAAGTASKRIVITDEQLRSSWETFPTEQPPSEPMLAYEPTVPPTTSPIESAVVHSIADQAPQPVVANRGRAFASATLIVALVLGLLAGRAIVNRLAAPAQVTRAAAVQSAAPSQTPTPAKSPRAATVVPQAAVADGADEAVPARLPAADAANVGERARPPASEVANTGERRRPPVRARSIAPSAPATARAFAGRPSAPPRATIEKSPPVAPRVGQPVAASVAAATTPASRAAAPTASAVALATPVAAANSAPAAAAPAVVHSNGCRFDGFPPDAVLSDGIRSAGYCCSHRRDDANRGDGYSCGCRQSDRRGSRAGHSRRARHAVPVPGGVQHA
jgi:hypothetical protein